MHQPWFLEYVSRQREATIPCSRAKTVKGPNRLTQRTVWSDLALVYTCNYLVTRINGRKKIVTVTYADEYGAQEDNTRRLLNLKLQPSVQTSTTGLQQTADDTLWSWLQVRLRPTFDVGIYALKISTLITSIIRPTARGHGISSNHLFTEEMWTITHLVGPGNTL